MNVPLDHAPWWGFALLFVLFALLLWMTDRLARRDGRHAGLHEADQRDRLRDKDQFIRGKCAGIRECADWMHAAGYLPRRVALPASLLEQKPETDKASQN